MFDLSMGKLLLLALIALLVLGPDKLPGAARTLGAMVRRLRAAWDNVRSDLERELEVEEIRRAANKAAAEAEAAQNQANETLRTLQAEVEKVRAETEQLGSSAKGDDAGDDHAAAPAAQLSENHKQEPGHGQG